MIYINDLPDGLESLAKLFADDTSLFSKVYDSNLSARQLSNDLQKITVWAHKWKMIFNPDISKQAQEVVFSRKTDKVNHMPLTFNAISVAQTSHPKVQKKKPVCSEKKLLHQGENCILQKII